MIHNLCISIPTAQDVDPADLGPYWYIKRDDSGMMDGESSELPEDLQDDLEILHRLI